MKTDRGHRHFRRVAIYNSIVEMSCNLNLTPGSPIRETHGTMCSAGLMPGQIYVVEYVYRAAHPNDQTTTNESFNDLPPMPKTFFDGLWPSHMSLCVRMCARINWSCLCKRNVLLYFYMWSMKWHESMRQCNLHCRTCGPPVSFGRIVRVPIKKNAEHA